jgi:hypothetical protein
MVNVERKQSEPALPDNCLQCGARTEHGFGLAGGGYGPYVFCPNEACGYFSKLYLPDDEA